jgi:hypothetical protein
MVCVQRTPGRQNYPGAGVSPSLTYLKVRFKSSEAYQISARGLPVSGRNLGLQCPAPPEGSGLDQFFLPPTPAGERIPCMRTLTKEAVLETLGNYLSRLPDIRFAYLY